MTADEPAPAPLRRCLGTMGVLFLTLSVATPASSVFVIVPGMLQVAGTGALWALALAGVVCVATAFVYAELSSAWPDAGGEYVMVTRTLGPAAGFAMLGINLFNNLLFPPVAALGVAAVAGTVLPGLPPVPVAVAVMVVATACGVLDVRVNALVTGGFLAAEAAALAVVAWLGWAAPLRGLGAMLAHPAMPAGGGALVPATPAAIGVAASIAVFALNGYGAAVYFGEEMVAAPRRIARAVLLALVASLAMEALPVAATLAAARDLPALFAADDPFGGFVAAAGGRALAATVAAGIVVAIVNAVIAGLLAGARFLYATARDGSWGGPLDRLLGTIHPRFGSPAGATLASGGVGILACLLPMRLLLVLSGAGLLAIYAGITAAAVAARRRGLAGRAGYRMPLWPAAPVVAAAAIGYVAWLTALDPQGRTGLAATAAQVALALGYWRLALRRRGWGISPSASR